MQDGADWSLRRDHITPLVHLLPGLLRWIAYPGASKTQIMPRCTMPTANHRYGPFLGVAVSFRDDQER